MKTNKIVSKYFWPILVLMCLVIIVIYFAYGIVPLITKTSKERAEQPVTGYRDAHNNDLCSPLKEKAIYCSLNLN